jgi:hypothetical protein
MVATRAFKRAVVDSRNPLQHEGLREHIFSFVGAGHWWFVAQVSRGWKMSYENVGNCKLEGLQHWGEDTRFTCTAKCTLMKAAFASVACCTLATDPHVDGGLRLGGPDWRVQRYGGQCSDLDTLRLAHERGLPATDITIQGAAERGSLSKVQWLHEMRREPLPIGIDGWAAESGNIELLDWLTEQGCKFRSLHACVAAAAAGHKHVLCYLQERGCKWDEHTTAVAAKYNHLSLVKWLLSAGCPFQASSMCEGAASSGSIEMMVYARQRGCELNAGVMQAAAEKGHLSMCQYLLSEGCAWDAAASNWAAYSGHLDTLRWLREHGCPLLAADACIHAAEGGHIDTIHYLLLELAPATPELLRDMLAAAGTFAELAAVQWLRQQGAEWPDVLQHRDVGWKQNCLAWARQQGCTAPTLIYDEDDDEMYYQFY